MDGLMVATATHHGLLLRVRGGRRSRSSATQKPDVGFRRFSGDSEIQP